MKRHSIGWRNFYTACLCVLFLVSVGLAQRAEHPWHNAANSAGWDQHAYRAPTAKRRIALSLASLQTALAQGKIEPDAPLPITTLLGMVTGHVSGDLILIGVEEVGDGVVPLVPDDIVLAMRSIILTDESPGMSIDPRFHEANRQIEDEQDVVYFGGIRDTRAGLFAFNSDYWMKRLAAGEVSIPLKEFPRYADLVISQQHRIVEKGNRFWFYPKASRIRVSSDYTVMLLEESGVEVLTEEQHYASVSGPTSKDKRKKNVDLLAKIYADQFTAHYDALKAIYPDLARLKNFMALCELFTWYERQGVRHKHWDFLLYHYQPISIHTPTKAKTIRTVFPLDQHALTFTGGVQIAIRLPAKPIVDTTRRLLNLKQVVLQARTPLDILHWPYRTADHGMLSDADHAMLKDDARLSSIKKLAAKVTNNGVIADFFVDSNREVQLNIIGSGGEVVRIPSDAAEEMRALLRVTSNLQGKMSQDFLNRWDQFYNRYLASFSQPRYWETHDGNIVKLKPPLIITSNDLTYKISGIERIPALIDNFLVFAAVKSTAEESYISAMENLIDRIRSIPRLTKENSAFTISLPTEIQHHIASNWSLVIRNLQQTINIENVILNPSIDEFKNILYDKRKNILVELTHTEQGIVLRDDRVFTSKEIESGDSLSHLKYILSGICTCNLPLLENGSYVQSLLSKGAGIINGSHRDVSSDTGLKRLNQLIEIIKHIEHYNVPAYYLIDIIDQMQNIPGRGTINLGQKWIRRDRFLG